MRNSTRRTTSAERLAGGQWLRDRRNEIGLTQREVALMCDFEYYTTVSEIEMGKARDPPIRYESYARAMKMPVKDFVRELMRYYDHHAWAILFGNNPTPSV